MNGLIGVGQLWKMFCQKLFLIDVRYSLIVGGLLPVHWENISFSALGVGRHAWSITSDWITSDGYLNGGEANLKMSPARSRNESEPQYISRLSWFCLFFLLGCEDRNEDIGYGTNQRYEESRFLKEWRNPAGTWFLLIISPCFHGWTKRKHNTDGPNA